jgi:hypothetical protein
MVGTYNGDEYRNFFVFGLSGVHGNMSSAALEVYDPSESREGGAAI